METITKVEPQKVLSDYEQQVQFDVNMAKATIIRIFLGDIYTKLENDREREAVLSLLEKEYPLSDEESANNPKLEDRRLRLLKISDVLCPEDTSAIEGVKEN